MNGRFSDSSKQLIDSAISFARSVGHTYIGSEHILFALLREKGSICERMLSERGLSAQKIRLQIISKSGLGKESTVSLADMTPRCKRLLKRASSEADDFGNSKIENEHILMAILGEECEASSLLIKNGVRLSELYILIDSFLSKERYSMQITRTDYDEKISTLKKHGRDLNEMAKLGELDEVIGREKEEERLIRILLRRRKNNPLLIGEAGVGKTAIAEAIASRIVSGNIPERLKTKRIFSLDMSSIVAGTKYRGEFEEKMKTIINEIRSDGNIILFIDEIHTMVGAGAAEGAVDASNILKPSLARGEVQIIGATTLEEYRKTIERDAALDRRFQSITVSEPTKIQCINILNGIKNNYEKHHNVKYTDEAIEAAVELSIRYVYDKHLPDKAIDLLDESAARKSVLGDNVVDVLDIEKTVELMTGIPVVSIDENKKLSDLENAITEEIIGQNNAISLMCEAIRRSRSGIGDNSGPIASFLFCGNSGVGKTATARVLSKAMFGEDSLLQLDMSEYSEQNSVSRLLGASPGYVGYGERCILGDFVRKTPYCVVLLDEIEKASPDVLALLLQILDNGSINDSIGRRICFSNTIIIMTTNENIRPSAIGFDNDSDIRSKFFSQELLDRIDEIIKFEPLSQKTLETIANNYLKDLTARLIKQGFELTYNDVLCKSLAEKCKSGKGVRGLKNEIRRCVEQPIATDILNGKIKRGDKISL